MEIVKEPKKVTIYPELKNDIQTLVEEESQVIIHLHFTLYRLQYHTYLEVNIFTAS